jgi:hypothetical protein
MTCLPAKGYGGLTAWDKVTFYCNKDILDPLWGWRKEVKGNLKDNLLIAN